MDVELVKSVVMGEAPGEMVQKTSVVKDVERETQRSAERDSGQNVVTIDTM